MFRGRPSTPFPGNDHHSSPVGRPSETPRPKFGNSCFRGWTRLGVSGPAPPPTPGLPLETPPPFLKTPILAPAPAGEPQGRPPGWGPQVSAPVSELIPSLRPKGVGPRRTASPWFPGFPYERITSSIQRVTFPQTSERRETTAAPPTLKIAFLWFSVAAERFFLPTSDAPPKSPTAFRNPFFFFCFCSGSTNQESKRTHFYGRLSWLFIHNPPIT